MVRRVLNGQPTGGGGGGASESNKVRKLKFVNCILGLGDAVA